MSNCSMNVESTLRVWGKGGGGAKSAPIQMLVSCLFLQKSGLNAYPHTASDALAQETWMMGVLNTEYRVLVHCMVQSEIHVTLVNLDAIACSEISPCILFVC